MADLFETELNKLGRGPGAKPDAAAKARALALAVVAFDDEQKKSAGTQGSENRRRYTNALKHLWSLPMNKKYLAASVAAALVLPAAGLTIHLMSDRPAYYMAADRGGVSFDNTPGGTAGDVAMKVSPTTDYLYRNDIGVPEANHMETDILAQETSAQFRERMAAVDLAVIESLRLSSGQMSGDVREASPRLQAIAMEQTAMEQIPSVSRARFAAGSANTFHDVAVEPVSTFSADVDTTSYSYARREILAGRHPDADSVRVEEMLNYFPYDLAGPESRETPFKPNVTVMTTPWNKDTKLVHVGIKGFDVPVAAQAPSNLVFLIDVSGSMESADKLPLLKTSFRMLVNKLKPEDTVSIVTYAGTSGVALEPTKVADKERILSVIDGLEAGGSTAGADGLAEAYRLAERSFVKDGVNRIMLATDGDFNIGPSSDEEMKKLVETKRKSGVFLSVLGFGSDFYNDALMQTLAQNGNGVAAYIDTLSEAQKALVQEASASLFTIAKDVKLQVEFNPDKVSEYRLIGYETRALEQKDFNNDKVDAGEIGSGHTVTAIYEIVPKGSHARSVDDLRYSKPETLKEAGTGSDELAFVKIRYKEPDGGTSKLISVPVTAADADRLSFDVKFSVAVAAFGQKLKGEAYVADFSWSAVRSLAEEGLGDDPFGYRAEFLKLVDVAGSLPGVTHTEAPGNMDDRIRTLR
ncbi:VWA domain-containing protein [Pararhizobium sp. BT-229]|uniref:vWA domain-containing protein n=1 Tax=Pararhizobium sp. BT-229 TaxID=2986923 RepID=UPI0021F6A218|nr:VWA domain-containing protein [Pararhizobium sp. BT-229]MCV9964978.1 VWA domain-containing protein [Pararhizobium sp. BT-229]